MQIREGASHSAGFGIEPLAEVEGRTVPVDIIQIVLDGALQEAGLKERAKSFRVGPAAPFKLHRVLLAVVQDQERIRREQIVPLGRVIMGRAAHHRFEGQGRAAVTDLVACTAAVQRRRAVWQIPRPRIQAEPEAGHCRTPAYNEVTAFG
ncbi:MAG TPA: hypothetical protein VMT86_19125 [Bryobacteraceae bacterium]|nr:hypothetical protein [Bryobacteraceae bacterium]